MSPPGWSGYRAQRDRDCMLLLQVLVVLRRRAGLLRRKRLGRRVLHLFDHARPGNQRTEHPSQDFGESPRKAQ